MGLTRQSTATRATEHAVAPDGRIKSTAVRFVLSDRVHDVDSTRFEALPGESDVRRTRIVPHQNTVFRQLTKRLPWAALRRLVEQHRADKGVRRLSTEQLLLTLLLAQVHEARSLRDIEAILESQDARRYHSGLPAARRSTLADAAATRPPEVFAGVLAALIGRLAGPLPRGVTDCVRLIDSTTIPLSGLSADWARFSAKLCGAKAHVVFDPNADCPLYLGVTPARVNDITAAKAMPIEAGATYVFDLGYYDYAWWAQLDAQACRIVTRLRSNTPLRVIETLPLPAGAPAIVSDRIGFLPARLAAGRRNPMGDAVREINVRIDTGKVLRIVTNDLDAPADEIAGLYKRRWAIELFFRWIKQMLKLRHFYGVSENAVRLQIAVALIAFVLIKLAHRTRHAVDSVTRFGRLIRATILHRTPLDRLGLPGPPIAGAIQNHDQGVFSWA
jgi:hypothetical protein